MLLTAILGSTVPILLAGSLFLVCATALVNALTRLFS